MRDDASVSSVSLDTPLATLLPSFSILSNGWTSRAPITLKTLASHTAGLPRETPFPCGDFSWGQSGCTEEDILATLALKAAISAPHARFHYSNLGLALLGRALSHAVPLPPGVNRSLAYEHLMEKRILSPLGMINATFAFNNATAAKIAVGAHTNGEEVVITPGPTCGFGAPAGCLWASGT